MSDKPAIIWFRNDLRVEDNPALSAAISSGAPLIALYIFDEEKRYCLGSAARWWLRGSLASLGQALKKIGINLTIRRGDETEILLTVVKETEAGQVFWSRRYDEDSLQTDKSLKAVLSELDIQAETFNGALLREPWEIKNGSGGPYRVFTPFWKSLRAMGPARNAPLPAPHKVVAQSKTLLSDKLADWNLTPANPNWAREFEHRWRPGEQGAHIALERFLNEPINHYAEGRNRPDCEYTSRLSPHLAFGEISPVQIWRATQNQMAAGKVTPEAAEKFLSEVAWREFSYSLLFHNKDLPNKPLRQAFANYPWRDDPNGLQAWQRGQTGYPIVDAGMRQLWRTGWMHNRVRMIVASFLIKDLLINWKDGADWFWDTLVDADLASNAASWQWVAGCRADAAPYFRIFNPVSQGEKFDPDGNYIREFTPELSQLPVKYIHAPWKAPQDVLAKAGVTLGKTYPNPIVDHDQARRRALAGYDMIKGG